MQLSASIDGGCGRAVAGAAASQLPEPPAAYAYTGSAACIHASSSGAIKAFHT